MTAEAQVRLVVFDLDGTLIDSLGDLANSMNSVLERLSCPTHPREAYCRFVGDGVVMLVRRALPQDYTGDIDEVVSMMRSEYGKRCLETTRPFPDIPDLLTELTGRGVATAVLSNKPDAPTREVVGALFSGHDFAQVRGGLSGVPLKPDPTSVVDMCADLGVDRSKAIFVGDTHIDMETGCRAGMMTVGVTWGFRDREELVSAGAQIIIDSPGELLLTCGGQGPISSRRKMSP